MAEIECFQVFPTNKFQRNLRRFTFGGGSGPNCVNQWGHNASIDIEIIELDNYEYDGWGKLSWPHDDPRWPKKCAVCGYEFKPEDVWQENGERLYQTPMGLFVMRKLPPGSMWWGNKFMAPHPGPDGNILMVMLPYGVEWCVDYHPKYPNGWTRTGTMPKFTARPSILTSKYHGFLTDGKLIDC